MSPLHSPFVVPGHTYPVHVSQNDVLICAALLPATRPKQRKPTLLLRMHRATSPRQRLRARAGDVGHVPQRRADATLYCEM